jgi:hypothetical protein
VAYVFFANYAVSRHRGKLLTLLRTFIGHDDDCIRSDNLLGESNDEFDDELADLEEMFYVDEFNDLHGRHDDDDDDDMNITLVDADTTSELCIIFVIY